MAQIGNESVEFTSVTSKGQIVIPKSVRLGAGIKESDKLACFAFNGFVVLKKVELPGLTQDFESALNELAQAKTASQNQTSTTILSGEAGGGKMFHSDVMVGVRELHKKHGGSSAGSGQRPTAKAV